MSGTLEERILSHDDPNEQISMYASDIQEILREKNNRISDLEICLKRILTDLPSNRDWLDPVIEKVAKILVGLG